MAIFLILVAIQFVDLPARFAIIQHFKIPYFHFYNRLEAKEGPTLVDDQIRAKSNFDSTPSSQGHLLFHGKY